MTSYEPGDGDGPKAERHTYVIGRIDGPDGLIDDDGTGWYHPPIRLIDLVPHAARARAHGTFRIVVSFEPHVGRERCAKCGRAEYDPIKDCCAFCGYSSYGLTPIAEEKL